MNEASKAIARRLHDVRFASRYFVGSGIDIGAGNDSIAQYAEFFPGMRSLRNWDMPDGDAQLLKGIADESFHFVHSSHCLEHMRDPEEALRNWFRVLKPNGHLVCTVPDEDMYEQGRFPSTFNDDHKWTFSIWKAQSWSARAINLFDLLQTLGASAQTLKVELLDATYRYQLPRLDQTLTQIGESAIEFIVRKRPAIEIAAHGRLPKTT
ncbi:MAG TPA: class I SAM-dependent methyltransferase [Trinickia sp.]|jgi:SAM-dependent methyltransferase|nr:class I SAM-dependent methyltransferase [Trinickia sp.]